MNKENASSPTTDTHRRGFLKLAGLTAVGAGIGALGFSGGFTGRLPFAIKVSKFTKPKISYDRILRVTVGLRPHRASGFVVRAEPLGSKTLIHNYGHGGSGWSLSWGTATLVLDEVLKTGVAQIGIVGCGINGLTTARLLQRRGFQVTIYAKESPPYVTSSFATAVWSPTATLVDEGKFTPEFKATFSRIARISHRNFQSLIGNPNYGVEYQPSYRCRDQPMDPILPDYIGSDILDLNGETVDVPEGSTPFRYKYVQSIYGMRFQVPRYLSAMLDDFQIAGGKLVIREFKRIEDIDALPEKVVVNAMGLGTKALFKDDELMPIRGQLTHLVPQPGLDYRLGTEGLSFHPRADAVSCGGSTIPNVWDTAPDKSETARVIDGLIGMVETRCKFA
ncbi:MAG TPA: FAD-dependent oxidoreductase [Opitutaceae bacterium]|nr:FAD-dependent oxidoreductase [Opitutaceae bacterium]